MRALYLVPLFLLASLAAGQTVETQLSASLRPYVGCHLPAGPDVVEVTQLPAGNHVRTVDTLRGPRQIQMLDGVRVMFAYPNTDFFANVKTEELPASSYEMEKTEFSSAFEKTFAAGGNRRNYMLKPTMQGFEISGLDGEKLDGGVLGMYLLFDNSSHVVTTIYFLNAEPSRRRFSNLKEYAALRDKFLTDFTACVRGAITARH